MCLGGPWDRPRWGITGRTTRTSSVGMIVEANQLADHGVGGSVPRGKKKFPSQGDQLDTRSSGEQTIEYTTVCSKS